MGTILTPDGMLWIIAYTYKRKHECSVLLLKFGEFKCKDNIAMLFLLTAFALESKCKSTKNISYGKKIFPHVREKVYLCNVFFEILGQ